MQQQILLPAALVLLNAVGGLAQEATTSSSPLGQFLDGVNGAANNVNSALSAQSSTSSSSSSSPTSIPASSSTTPTAAASTSAALGGGGLTNGAKIGIIVGCVVAAVLIIGILAGICCCLMLRKCRRRRAAISVAGEDEKAYKTIPSKPGRDYSPVSSHGQSHSMDQHPTVPLMAAGAIPQGRHSQAPSLSQHPAMRNSNENPFADSVGGTRQTPHSSHHSLGAGVAGATAAGAAGYGLHKHHQNQQPHPASKAPIAHHTAGGLISPTGHNPNRGSGNNLTGPAPVGAAGYSNSDPYSATGNLTAGRGAATTSPLGPATGSGLEGIHHHDQPSTYQPPSQVAHTQDTHQGLSAALGAPLVGGMAGQSMHQTPGITQPGSATYSSATNQNGLDHHNGLNSYGGPTPASGLNTLPSSNYPASGAHNGLKASAGAAAVAGTAAYGVDKHEEKRRLRDQSHSRSRSRSNSRPRSGNLPTRNDADRPPTPFGLSGIGQPYEDTHVHVLQNEAPSSELQRSLQSREASFAAGAPSNSQQARSRNSRGYSTPPLVPSRSPNREYRMSMPTDSSTDSTSSNSGGERYSQANDPYQPAHPNRSSVPPWEQHQTRYSGTPPTSADMAPPPVPWESNDYPQQRRQNHSPRQSIDASGRRQSRSPATSINGQLRRLRFEDLQAPGQGNGNVNANAGYGGAGQHNSNDGYDYSYDHGRWSGIGEAH